MGRRSTFASLEPQTQARVLAVMRANRHKAIDDIRAILIAAEGIDISRSAVHRTLLKINARDQLLARADEQTVVTAVDRASGEVLIIKTALPAVLIERLIREAESAA